MPIVLDARIPSGPIEQKWDRCRFEMKLVNPPTGASTPS